MDDEELYLHEDAGSFRDASRCPDVSPECFDDVSGDESHTSVYFDYTSVWLRRPAECYDERPVVIGNETANFGHVAASLEIQPLTGIMKVL